MRFRVFAVEDQISRESIEMTFERDAARPERVGARLELCAITDDYQDAIQQLTAFADSGDGLPEAVLLDNYVLDNNQAVGRAFDVMKWIGRRCIEDQLPHDQWPRAVLWTSFDDPNDVYTFCVLGGVQFQEKRATDGLQAPVQAIWEALAGHRWRPCPYPADSDLTSSVFRNALPYFDYDLPNKQIANQIGCSERTLKNFPNHVGTAPGAPGEKSPDYPYNTRAALRLLRRRGWVWVPYRHLGSVPPWAPLPHTIDPDLYAQGLPPLPGVPAALLKREDARRG
jgi:hypothetical protein